jgi:hypothetical protein
VLVAAGVPQALWPLVHGRVLGLGEPEAPVLAEQYVPTLLHAEAEAPTGELDGFAVRRFALLEGGVELHVVGEEGVLSDWRVDQRASPSTPQDATQRLFALRQQAGAIWQPVQGEEAPGLDAFSREALRALGYLGAE